MAKFSFGEIIAATGGLPSGAAAADTGMAVTGISTDTRTLKAGEAFFALIGENHDAHGHLGEAADKGAALLVVSDAAGLPEGFAGAVLTVEDGLRAYQDLAAYYRKKIDPFVIAVTGSVGKTTVKDMIGCILNGLEPENPACGRVYCTQGNLNNQVGLPRTILEAGEDTKILVTEMGLAGKGDIERLAEIALPDVAVITNVGLSHRENFDDDDGILYAKYEVAAFLGEGGTLVIDAGGNEKLDKLAMDGSREKGFKLLRVAREGTMAAGSSRYTVTRARVCEKDPGVTLFEVSDGDCGEPVAFAVPVPGEYVGVSAALAAAACKGAGVSLASAAEALKNLKRTPHRLEPFVRGGMLVIDDTYNASPDSVKSGLDYLGSVPAKKRVAVLADMNELGGDSSAMHREIGAYAVGSGADRLYIYGEKAKSIADGAEEAAEGRLMPEIRYYGVDDKEAMIADLIKEAEEGNAVYVKGSRSMKMEEAVTALIGHAEGAEA